MNIIHHRLFSGVNALVIFFLFLLKVLIIVKDIEYYESENG